MTSPHSTFLFFLSLALSHRYSFLIELFVNQDLETFPQSGFRSAFRAVGEIKIPELECSCFLIRKKRNLSPDDPDVCAASKQASQEIVCIDGGKFVCEAGKLYTLYALMKGHFHAFTSREW